MSFHDRIREARKERHMTQEGLGEKLGVAKTTIAGYEKNREPTAAQLAAIADALGIDVGYLLQDEVRQYKEQNAGAEREAVLLQCFRELNEEGQDTALNVVRSLAASGQFKKIDESGLVEEAAG